MREEENEKLPLNGSKFVFAQECPLQNRDQVEMKQKWNKEMKCGFLQDQIVFESDHSSKRPCQINILVLLNYSNC